MSTSNQIMAKEFRITPRNLLEAAASGDVGEVMKLLDVSSTDQSEVEENRAARPNDRDVNKQSAIDLAVAADNIVALQTLVRAGADTNLLNYLKKTPLLLAAQNNSPLCLGELIKLGADINCVDNEGRTALMSAARYGKRDCLQLLVEAGADLNLQRVKHDCGDFLGPTALMYAAENRNVNCLKLLLEAGCDVNVKTSDGETALHYTICQSFNRFKLSVVPECVKILMESGSDVMAADTAGRTVLTYAAQENCLVHLLPIFVEAGAVVDHQDSSGMTALTHAVSKGSHKCVRWLIDHGASVNTRDHSCKTPLHYLVFDISSDLDAEQVLQILLSKQVDVNTTDKDGMTPLMYYVAGGDTVIIDMLLEHGAEINLVDNLGRTALMHSLVHNCIIFNPKLITLDLDKFTDCFIFLLNKVANLSGGQTASGSVIFESDLDLIKFQAGGAVELEFVSVRGKKKRRILQCLIINGLIPSLHLRPDGCRVLESADLGVVKYLIATCFLRPEDYCLLSVMNNLRSQPWPLVKLCFVAVSTAFGASPRRLERIKKSQLPPKLQNMLLFREPWSRLCVHQWDTIPLTFNFSPEKYEKLPRPRPLLYHWPVGQALVPCDCGQCDGTMYRYEGSEEY